MNHNYQYHILYRWFDKSGKLLYVGITSNFKNRLDSHQKGKPWWAEVASGTLEHFENRLDLRKAEIRAINTENPAYNVKPNNAISMMISMESAPLGSETI